VAEEDDWLEFCADAEVISVDISDASVTIEFRDEGLADTHVVAIRKEDFKQNGKDLFIKSGSKLDFLKTASDIPKACGGLDSKPPEP
jgi:hypothetical protein